MDESISRGPDVKPLKMLGTPTVHYPPVGRFIPQIPTQFQIYDSYLIDPQWQIKFTIIWTSVLAFTTIASIPFILRSWRSGRLYSGLLVCERMDRIPGHGVAEADSSSRPSLARPSTSRMVMTLGALWQSFTYMTFPLPRLSKKRHIAERPIRTLYASLSVAQMLLVLAYAGTVVACFTTGAQLRNNSNRAGFIGVATLPVIFLLSLKSPLPLPVFLPSLSYENYNFLHRWAGRVLFLCISVHGGLWCNQFISTGQWDQMTATKTVRGLLSYGLLGGIVITSLKPVRRMCYQLFWIAHVLLVVGFFAAISYHTPYARPWIYPCIALYTYDVAVRCIRFRIKDAVVSAIDSIQTLIYIPDCDYGWLPTQHVFLRVFRGPGIFESHPFTITNAAAWPGSGSPRGIVLYASIAGDWTRRLHESAVERQIGFADLDDLQSEQDLFLALEKKSGQQYDESGKRVKVMIDGPYGGLKIDLAVSNHVLVIAGGSGVTFLLGTMEEVLRCHRCASPTKVTAVWTVATFASVEGLSSTFSYLSERAGRLGIEFSLEIHARGSSAVSTDHTLPANTIIHDTRLNVPDLIRKHVTIPSRQDVEDGGAEVSSGGLAVIACGPESLVAEARNVISLLSISDRVRAGGVVFHGESYAL
ncbi:hypothetical protein BD324DRAFT_627198 [Kockovaella imperatae]|uniref:FAD-binding FR-type domain-containing protein n=1 Tax=Kockovaella imperatae TaxID=4999 RepID=A0A1Y1UFJ5_9TREE|nr:hypothetical protein BD324DRAFT_627198 [Kockovaella imperatae]ORX36798.1 hypothetical protein BD324DRAFT_627198 [Kockovaella imperatae]